MKAYEVKYGTKVVVADENVRTAPISPAVANGDEITIYKLDGMYCNGLDKTGNRIYIAAWTNVEVQ